MDFRIYVTGDPVLVGVDDTGAISVADGADEYVIEIDAYGCVCTLTIEYDDEAATL